LSVYDTLFLGETRDFAVTTTDKFGNPVEPASLSITTTTPGALSIQGSKSVTASSSAGSGVLRVIADDVTLDKSIVLDRVRYRDIAVTQFTSCALAHRGALFCWGRNWGNALGDPTLPETQATPVQIRPDLTFDELVGGSLHFCAKS